MKWGLILILIGIILMIVGAGSNALQELSTIKFTGEGVAIEGLNDLSASFIFIGIVIALIGVFLYIKQK